MATTIVTKYGSDAPAASDIVRGELAVDTENGRLYTENAAGAVVEIGLKPEANVDVTGTITATGTSVFTNLDISGDIDVDGTTNLDVVDIDGAVDFASTTAHAGNATFADNAKAIFGTGDLQIYHDGSNSYIKDSGTGSLLIDATNLYLRNISGKEYASFISDGAVNLKYNGSTRIVTTSTGIDVTGNVTIPTGNKIAFDTDGQTYITEDQDERMRVWVANTEFMRLTNDTVDEIRLLPYGGTTYTGGNLDVTGTATMDGLTTNGASEGDTYFTGGTASSRLLNVFTSTHDGGANAGHNFKIASGQGAFIFGNATTANLLTVKTGGIDVTGSVTADGLTVDGAVQINSGSSGQITLDATDQYNQFVFEQSGVDNSGGDLLFDHTNEIFALRTLAVADIELKTSPITGQSKTRLLAASNGDISFYEDTGTTAKLFWDASAESLGIGTSSPDSPLEIQAATNSSSDTTYLKLYNAGENVGNIDFENGNGSLARITGTKAGAGASANDGILTFSTAFNASLAERMRINSSGNVGIGGNGTGNGLGVYLSKGTGANFFEASDGTKTMITGSDSSQDFVKIGSLSAHPVGFVVGNGEKMRIDSSGNLLVGKTAVDFGTVGAEILPTGVIRSAVGGGYCLMVNRKDSDGEIINFRKDGATVGSIFNSGTTMGVGSLDTGVLLANNIDAILPWNASTNAERDNAIDLGRSSGRFKDLYLSGHTRYNSEVYVGDGASISGSYSANDLLLHTDNNPIIFRPNGSEAARFDSSQNFLVGTTDSTPYNNNAGSTADNGIALSEAGWLAASRYQGTVAFFNRTNNDGDIAVFRKDGTTIGNINTASGYLQVQSAGGNFRWGANNTNQLSVDANQMYPMLDNALSLGGPTVRFKDAYLSGGIYLGGTAAANKLDDYEEGSWVPNVHGDATGVITTGSTGSYYTKVGNLVTIYGSFRVTTNFSDKFVGGLPFQIDFPNSSSSYLSGGVVMGSGSNTVCITLENNTSALRLHNNQDVGNSHAPNTTTEYYRFQFSYRTNA